jgi:hypothetical protein
MIQLVPQLRILLACQPVDFLGMKFADGCDAALQ